MKDAPVPWTAAEPRALRREKEAVAAIAPDLQWLEDGAACGWRGLAPVWPFDRPKPVGLDGFLQGRRFEVEVQYSQAHPMVDPKVWPIEPDPEFLVRTAHEWHVNGDGSLCLLQAADDWHSGATAADIVVKASGWFLEYLLLTDGKVETMTEAGIVNDPSLDHLFCELPS